MACIHENRDSWLQSDLTVSEVSADGMFSYKEKSNNPGNFAFVSVHVNPSQKYRNDSTLQFTIRFLQNIFFY